MSEPKDKDSIIAAIKAGEGTVEAVVKPGLISITSHDSSQAFLVMRPEIESVPAARATSINTDVGFAVQTALWMVTAIEGVRPELEKAVPSYDIKSVLARFRGAALSLNYLQARIRVLLRTNNSPLVQRLTKRRSIFHNDLEGLVLRDLMDGTPLAGLRHTNNYQMLAYDVMGLVDLLQEHYPKFDGKCMTSEADLVEARTQANELFTEMGNKQFGPKTNAALKLLRRQCFALLNDLWKQLESYLPFARLAQGDASQFIRTLYGNRSNGKPSSSNDEDDDEIDASENDAEDAAPPADDEADPLNLDVQAINQTLAAATTTSATAPVRPGFPGAPALRAKTDE